MIQVAAAVHKLRLRGDAASALRLLGRARDKVGHPAPGSPLARLAAQIDAARAAIAGPPGVPAAGVTPECVPEIEAKVLPFEG